MQCRVELHLAVVDLLTQPPERGSSKVLDFFCFFLESPKCILKRVNDFYLPFSGSTNVSHFFDHLITDVEEANIFSDIFRNIIAAYLVEPPFFAISETNEVRIKVPTKIFHVLMLFEPETRSF